MYNSSCPFHSELPRCQIHIELILVPKVEDLLLLHPVDTILCNLQVKVPEQASQDDAHLEIRQAEEVVRISWSCQGVQRDGGGRDSLLAKAVAGSNVEGLEGFLMVVFECRVVEPALRVEVERVLEVLLVVVHGPLVDGDNVLHVIVSVGSITPTSLGYQEDIDLHLLE